MGGFWIGFIFGRRRLGRGAGSRISGIVSPSGGLSSASPAFLVGTVDESAPEQSAVKGS